MVRWALNHPSFRHISYLVALSICLYLLVDAMVGVMFGVVSAQPSHSGATAVAAESQTSLGKPFGFPDFGYMLAPEDHQGRVFRLRQDYPTDQLGPETEVQALLALDFQADAERYSYAVRDYVLAGNIERPGYENDFFLEDNLVRDWYHAPWQHWGPTGSEGFHGLTQADPIAAYTLAPTQSSASHTYVVDFYNDLGGYTIGQIWQDPFAPDLDFMANGYNFPTGTVIGRMIFTTLDANELPGLINPVEWSAYVYTCDLPQATSTHCDERQQATVRLIQLDVLVRDPRATTSGWINVSYVYNGALGQANRWANLAPVGQPGENPVVAPGVVVLSDLSLQLNHGLQNFVEFQTHTAQGIYGADYAGNAHAIRRNIGE